MVSGDKEMLKRLKEQGLSINPIAVEFMLLTGQPVIRGQSIRQALSTPRSEQTDDVNQEAPPANTNENHG